MLTMVLQRGGSDTHPAARDCTVAPFLPVVVLETRAWACPGVTQEHEARLTSCRATGSWRC